MLRVFRQPKQQIDQLNPHSQLENQKFGVPLAPSVANPPNRQDKMKRAIKHRDFARTGMSWIVITVCMGMLILLPHKQSPNGFWTVCSPKKVTWMPFYCDHWQSWHILRYEHLQVLVKNTVPLQMSNGQGLPVGDPMSGVFKADGAFLNGGPLKIIQDLSFLMEKRKQKTFSVWKGVLPFWNPPHRTFTSSSCTFHEASMKSLRLPLLALALWHKQIDQAFHLGWEIRWFLLKKGGNKKSTQQKFQWKFSQLWFLKVILQLPLVSILQVASHTGATIAIGTSVASASLLKKLQLLPKIRCNWASAVTMAPPGHRSRPSKRSHERIKASRPEKKVASSSSPRLMYLHLLALVKCCANRISSIP